MSGKGLCPLVRVTNTCWIKRPFLFHADVTQMEGADVTQMEGADVTQISV